MPPKPKPSSADWEKQKEAIRRLYLGQDLTLQKVRTQLEDNGFTATKAQYEAKFKEWGFSKNVPVITWKHVGFKIGKRKREGKESVVSINGIEIPIKRVKKEISRHYYSVIERAEFEKINAPSPPGSLAVVSTPPSQQEVLIVERWPSNLPWFSFIRFLDTRLEGLPRVQLNPQMFQGGLPFTQKKSQANENLVEQSRREISDGRQLVFDTIKEYAFSDLNHALLPFSSDVDWPEDVDPGMSLDSTSSNHWGLKMLIYLASNKLLESSEIGAIWKMIDNTGINKLANFSNSSVWKHTSLEAAMECLFETGIKQGHDRLVRWLLDSGMEPNTKVRLESAETEAHLPLIVALSSSHWNAETMVQLLLSKGSSPVLICCEKHGSPIQFLIGNRNEMEYDWEPSDPVSRNPENRRSFRDVFLKIMETLDQHPESQSLRYGDDFNVDLSTLWHDLIEEDSYMDQEEDYNFPDLYSLIELVEAVATRISNPGASVMTPTVLIRAAENYHEGLIRFMHKHGQIMDCCDEDGRFPLLAALEISEFKDYDYDGISIDNVKLLLELGASADYIPSSQVHAGCSPALSAAIHNAANLFPSEAVELLVQHGAHAQGLPTCGEEGHLSLLDCVRSQKNWLPREFTRALISLHHAGLPLPEWSLISVLELARQNNHSYGLRKCYEMLLETSPEICSYFPLHSELGWTALEYAVYMGEQQLARILVQHGAKHMSTHAYLDLLTGDFTTEVVEDIVFELRKARKTEQSRDLMFRRLLEILRTTQRAYQDGEVFSDLLRQYCKMPRSSDQEAYVIHEACNSGQENLITIAMEMLPNTYSSDALGTLVSSQKLDAESQRIFIHKLLGRRSGARLDSPTETQMFISVIDEALRAGEDGRVLEWLVTHDEKGFKNAYPHSSKFALKFFTRSSIKMRHIDEFVTPWLDHGLTVSPYFGIMVACTSPAEKMGVLLDHGFQSNRRLRWSLTVLQIAIARGDKAMTLRLLKAGCNVNARPPWRDIPKSIHERMQGDILEVLTSQNEQTRRRTALQLAAEEGNTSLVKTLLDFGANVNGQPARVGGATALQIACIKGYIEIARLLISKGADINAPGAEYFGRTALEGAAENGRLDIVGLLFEHGCRVDGCFRREYIRAVGFAKAQGNHALSKSLQDLGAWTKADDDPLREIDLKDEEPSSRDLEEDLQEDEDVSEVDEYEDCYDYEEFYESYDDDEDDEDVSEVDMAEIEYDAEALFPDEPGRQNDSADHSTPSQAWNTTSSLIRSAETEYTDWDKLIGIYASQEEPF